MSTDIEVASALIELEAQLRQLGLWEQSPPPPEALASTEPFCIDTLSLPQWLQFIFLPTLHTMLEQQVPLPRECAVAAIAEEYFKGSSFDARALMMVLKQLDDLLSR